MGKKLSQLQQDANLKVVSGEQIHSSASQVIKKSSHPVTALESPDFAKFKQKAFDLNGTGTDPVSSLHSPQPQVLFHKISTIPPLTPFRLWYPQPPFDQISEPK